MKSQQTKDKYHEPFRRNENNKKPVIRQVIDLIPRHNCRQTIREFKSDKYCSKYKTYDQLVALLFGQLCFIINNFQENASFF
ncbi:MAG TPA: DUF4372 domain-containing protein, partial [Bacteroidales bacterium]|nr:DUF4372 domain-containing protein [Bacteroidales bacterium]